MTNNLLLPSAISISGHWTITDKSNSCTIHLSEENVESANGYKLIILSTCSPEILPQVPVAWRPTPDGIALLDQDGLSVLFFSREGMHYRSHIWERTGKVLKKN
ncbi:AprI/Inh family metalloprotease inhibitor [Serratia marcescens]|uniref:AprI/Inh family metalloprotease inhibitor n=1 Tax=Serratia marcescens TaxID=615 RepID=UPI0013779399|nr:AprI/Inh family metalloprotease inhibitor [Serratia marcescens]NCI84523.1 AprI/Inh family metalloprotease inhibitor [Serratia marcescens]NDI95898.1 AprI/Inh family metalloprotease inhibitor [Serratia marcescens]NDJ65015.1 AprI/Inh family metalloprotease inhibitor [Serratia marcescens]HAT3781507.1 AprI/Inh family metalloprotease inhibitor [Serratia marcescens]HAT3850622.1 AprI/Inh family metalloprotease inhibitor [Serratia marcescens]